MEKTRENPGSRQDHRGENDNPDASTTDARPNVSETGTGVNGDEARRHREFMERHVEELKQNLKKAKASLNAHKLHQKTKPSEDRAKKIAELEAEVIRLEAELREAEEHLKDLEPEEIPDEEQPWFKKVYANCTGYLIEDEEGNFKVYNDTAASRELRGMGISDRRDTHTTSPLDRALNRIRKRYQVDHYGPIAGYRPGIIKQGGRQIIITKGPELLKPAKGEFPIIREFIDGMLTPPQEDVDADQNIYAHAWNYLGVRPLYDGKINTAQILVLVGPPDTGKSVFQNLIVTPLLGGRAAKPYPYMVGRTDFNEDLFESEHLKCDDETPPRDHETRRLYASELKKLAADEYHWCQGKGKKAITLPPFWRVTVSINDDPDYLPAIPVNDETLKDKMITLKTYHGPTVKLVERLGGKEAFADKIKGELPAYLYWLLNEFQIPKELQDTRYGLKAFQHPEIVEAVEETTPQMQLLAGLEDVFSGEMKTFSVLHIWKSLSLEALPREVRPQSMTTLGRYLTTLDKVAPDKVKKVRDKKGVAYTLDFRKGRKPGVRAGS